MQKIKYFIESDKGKDIVTVLIIIFVGLGSFGLGRMSNPNQQEGLKIDYTASEDDIKVPDINIVQNTSSKATNTAATKSSTNSRNFFASNRGTKYYSVSCNAGKTIKVENRVYFDTQRDAEDAGYELSSSCQ